MPAEDRSDVDSDDSRLLDAEGDAMTVAASSPLVSEPAAGLPSTVRGMGGLGLGLSVGLHVALVLFLLYGFGDRELVPEPELIFTVVSLSDFSDSGGDQGGDAPDEREALRPSEAEVSAVEPSVDSPEPPSVAEAPAPPTETAEPLAALPPPSPESPPAEATPPLASALPGDSAGAPAIPLNKPQRSVVLPEPAPRSPTEPLRETVSESADTTAAPTTRTEALESLLRGSATVARSGGFENPRSSQRAGARSRSDDSDEAGTRRGVRERAIQSYNRQVADRLNRFKTYPRYAEERGQQGIVRLQITVDANGRVTDRRIVGSSGFRALDDEVLVILRRATPLPRPPDGTAPRTLIIPFNFYVR